MPTIPNYNPDIQLNSPQGGTVESVETAGRSGQLLENFGKAVVSVADAEYEDAKVKKVREQNTRAIMANSYRQKFVQIADTAEDEAYTSTDAAGNTLVPTFQKKYDKETMALTKDIKDPLLKTMVESHRQDAFNDKYRPLLAAKRTMYNDYAVKEYEGQMRASAGTIYGNPLAFEKEYGAYTTMINGSALNPSNKQKAVDLAGAEFAQNAVLGLANKGEYDSAQHAITGPLARYIKPDDQVKLMNKVAEIRLKAAETEIKESDRAFKQNEEKLKLINKQYFRDRLSTASELISLGEGKNGATVKEFESMINEDVGQGDLTYEQGKHLRDLVNRQFEQGHKEQMEDKAYTASNIYSEIGTSDNLAAVRKKAMAASSNRDITPQSTIQILNAIEAEENRRAARARAGKSKKDPNNDIAKKFIDQTYPPGTFGLKDDEQIREGYAVRKAYAAKYYGKDPKYAGNANASMDAVSKEFGLGLYNKDRIPFLPKDMQDVTNDIAFEAAKSEIARLYKTKGISEAQLNKTLNLIMKKRGMGTEPKKEKK